ncbi:hypothetical protein Sme01_63800 [Sphaerisporangium melleum]|uniref:Uncharacterized protein n=1 Tax=Sphaerisporangium melleum TaxID=321316 RepID=A0A917RGM0_9ACTN|nr:hypothetical protein [Sphaerisporangium melleum]GGL05312.1 hypothetical protein GCM10007964_54410 [Sphaerisporangium melleum]GII73904.1 hypothetical protein Sme01_63800 [Sphaerisporangium melleum]
MDSLLARVLEAHGGLERWKNLSTFTARITYGGPFWEFKGHADFVGDDLVEASLQREHFVQRRQSTGRTAVFDREADRLTVTGRDGEVLADLREPRSTFEGYTPETQWNLSQIAYFRSYATWHYLVEPYVFTWPGVEAHEVEPWTENGETWRVLSVTYPPSIHTHNATQLYYYDDSGLLRRLDYQPDVNGRTPVAHYIRAHEAVDGIPFPTKRHIHTRNEDGTPDLSWIPITVDLSDIKIS